MLLSLLSETTSEKCLGLRQPPSPPPKSGTAGLCRCALGLRLCQGGAPESAQIWEVYLPGCFPRETAWMSRESPCVGRAGRGWQILSPCSRKTWVGELCGGMAIFSNQPLVIWPHGRHKRCVASVGQLPIWSFQGPRKPQARPRNEKSDRAIFSPFDLHQT